MDNSWIIFYSSFADALREYRYKQKELLTLIKNSYQELEMRCPRLCNEGQQLNNIDPFTVYGLFNKGITNSNRIKIIKKLSEKIKLELSTIPSSFDGVPVFFNTSATLYEFDEKLFEPTCNVLWELFDAALDYADHEDEDNRKRFINAYNNSTTLRYVKYKLSMGLFWIRPYSYLNLDSKNRWFISEKAKFSEEISSFVKSLGKMPSAEEYLDLTKKIKKHLASSSYEYHSLPELSRRAFIVAENVNKENEQKKEPQKEIAIPEDKVNKKRYWVYSPGRNAVNWKENLEEGVMSIGGGVIGSFDQFKTHEELKNKVKEVFYADAETNPSNIALSYWQFYKDIKKGDVVFVKKGRSKIIGYGTVTGDYYFNDELKDNSDTDNDYYSFREVEWHELNQELDYYPYELAPMKSLTDITDKKYIIDYLSQKISELREIDEDPIIQEPNSEEGAVKYSKEKFLKEVFITESDYDTLVELLEQKQNIILQGPPGVGKTYIAKRLAFSIIGSEDEDRVQLVQFHQSYSYEDFVMGLKPNEKQGGFYIKEGAFYNFCKKANDDPEKNKKYFFIIDEINRGNLSKIFGELFMLLEKDKHGYPITLLYRDEQFCIPENVYIIGMMNTADRSLAIMDYALRRRFAFFDIKPAFESDSVPEKNGFNKYISQNEKIKKLIDVIKEINQEIANDPSLGKGYQIGHSYFIFKDGELKTLSKKRLENVIRYEILPLLSIYWMDDMGKIQLYVDKFKKLIDE